MASTVQYVVDAISVGSIYGLMALALALLFGVMRLMNFAYGELIMVGGYTMFVLRDYPWPLLVLGTLVVVTAVSLLTERLAFRPVRTGSPATLLITSFTVSVMLQNLARMTVGPIPKGVRPWDFLTQMQVVGGVQISRLDILTAFTTVILLIGMVLLLGKTMLGIQLRASTEDFQMARLVGVRANAVLASAFAITGLLAAVAALLLVAREGAVSPTMGTGPLLIAFVGAVIGGMGSLTGAAIGGFALGVVSTFLDAALPVGVAPFRDAFVFTAVIAILVIRPQGLIAAQSTRV